MQNASVTDRHAAEEFEITAPGFHRGILPEMSCKGCLSGEEIGGTNAGEKYRDLLTSAGDGREVIPMDEFDWEAEYQRLAATDPDFEAVRQSMREVIAEEMPDKEDDFCYNHEVFVKGYRAVKAAKHNRFDADLVERSRRGDIDAAQQMLIKAGIIDSLKEK
jgi:hypothetical protein